jgi:hypothetical protein
VTGTENALYSVAAESRDLVVELVRIKTRIDRLSRNLNHPYDANQASRSVESAMRSLAAVAQMPIPKGETCA